MFLRIHISINNIMTLRFHLIVFCYFEDSLGNILGILSAVIKLNKVRELSAMLTINDNYLSQIRSGNLALLLSEGIKVLGGLHFAELFLKCLCIYVYTISKIGKNREYRCIVIHVQNESR